MPNAATPLVIGGFATGVGLATLLALPGAAPSQSGGALPERDAPAPASAPASVPGPDDAPDHAPERDRGAITLAQLDALVRAPGEAAATLRPVPRD